MKKGLSTKEKKEIGLILGSVLAVAVVGLILTQMGDKRMETAVGAAIQLNPDIPTYDGVLTILNERCEAVSGDGDCNTLCGSATCIPLEESCTENVAGNQCLCCRGP